MATRRQNSLTRAKLGDRPTSSVPATSDIGENSASGLVESPQPRKRNKLDPHDFADGGGGGGAEAFRRDQKRRGKGPGQ